MGPTLCCERMIVDVCTGTSFLIVNESAGPLALGAVNGLAQTCISTMRAFAPTAASAFYAFTNERNCLWLTYATFAAWALLSAFAGSLIRSEAYSGTSRMGSSDELEALAPETQEMLEVTKVKQESSTP